MTTTYIYVQFETVHNSRLFTYRQNVIIALWKRQISFEPSFYATRNQQIRRFPVFVLTRHFWAWQVLSVFQASYRTIAQPRSTTNSSVQKIWTWKITLLTGQKPNVNFEDSIPQYATICPQFDSLVLQYVKNSSNRPATGPQPHQQVRNFKTWQIFRHGQITIYYLQDSIVLISIFVMVQTQAVQNHDFLGNLSARFHSWYWWRSTTCS